LLGKGLEPLGLAVVVSHLPGEEPDGLGRARVVALVQLVPAAELGAHGIPQELQQLDALDGAAAIGAAQIPVQVRTELRRLEVRRVRVQVDQGAAQDALDELLDLGIRDRPEQSIGLGIFRIGEHGVADPGDGRARHGVAQAPDEIAPGDQLADGRLHVPRLGRADGLH
jgi:hypothetical protein